MSDDLEDEDVDAAEQAKEALKQFDEASKRLEANMAAMRNKGSGINADGEVVEEAIKCMLEKDFQKAASLFQQAAEQGHMGAQSMIGECYAEGNGVEQDWGKARYWCAKAAKHDKQGDAAAQNYLGYMYYNGYGGITNKTKAKYWFSKAAKQGNASAERNLSNLSFGDPLKVVYSIIVMIALWVIMGLFEAYEENGFLVVLICAIVGWIIGGVIRKRLL